MKPVVMNSHIFNNIVPFQYVVPALKWSTGKSNWNISDLQVMVQLDYSTGKYQIRIMDIRNNFILMDDWFDTACAATGVQKNIDDVMGLVKQAIGTDRHVEVQQAANIFSGWFKEETRRWLRSEAERDFDIPRVSREYCEDLVYGIEVLPK